MKDNKLVFKSADEVEAVFYEAFMHCDRDVMAGLWSEEAICIHPGSGVIAGYESVIRSWAHIFSNAKVPQLEYKVLSKTTSVDMEVHIVEEKIVTGRDAQVVVLATNVFQKQDQGWLLKYHHSSVVESSVPAQTLQ